MDMREYEKLLFGEIVLTTTSSGITTLLIPGMV